MTGLIDIEELQLPHQGNWSRDVRDRVIGALDYGFDGRPDMWRAIGGKPGSPQIMVIAKLEDEPAGWAWGQKQAEEIPEALAQQPIHQLELPTVGTWFLKHVSVWPNKRRMGVGSALMDAAEAVAARHAVRGISVIVPLPDPPDPGPNPPVRGYSTGPNPLRQDTVGFFERRGYVVQAKVSHYYSLGVPVTNQLMIKEFA